MLGRKRRRKGVIARAKPVAPIKRISPFTEEERKRYKEEFNRKLNWFIGTELDKKPLTKEDYNFLNRLGFGEEAEAAIGRRFGRGRKDHQYMLALLYYRSRDDIKIEKVSS